MIRNLNKTYATFSKEESSNPRSINVGGFYVALVEEEVYVRTRILETYDKDVSCFLIDFGDELIVSKDKIYEMRREFAKDQAQVNYFISYTWNHMLFCRHLSVV